jgi:hypothetical protein
VRSNKFRCFHATASSDLSMEMGMINFQKGDGYTVPPELISVAEL